MHAILSKEIDDFLRGETPVYRVVSAINARESQLKYIVELNEEFCKLKEA